MHDGVVEMGRCRQRGSASTSGGQTTASHRPGGEENRQSEWVDFGLPKMRICI